MLGRGELRCIGATTLDEYRKYIEKDPALERRFQQVYVGQPSVIDTIAILRGLRERWAVVCEEVVLRQPSITAKIHALACFCQVVLTSGLHWPSPHAQREHVLMTPNTHEQDVMP